MSIEIVDIEPFPVEEREVPEGGWLQPYCDWDSHEWAISIEEGVASLECLDPCDLSKIDPSANPCCDISWVERHYLSAPLMSVKAKAQVETYPEGDNDFWIEISEA